MHIGAYLLKNVLQNIPNKNSRNGGSQSAVPPQSVMQNVLSKKLPQRVVCGGVTQRNVLQNVYSHSKIMSDNGHGMFPDVNCSSKFLGLATSTPPPHCVVINCTSFRGCLGLSEGPMDAIVDFMMGPKATMAEIHTLARSLKVRRNWEQVFLHAENYFVHETRSMFYPPPPPLTGLQMFHQWLLVSVVCAFPVPFAQAANHMYRIMELIKSVAPMGINYGHWKEKDGDKFPLWECVAKCPLRSP